MKTLWRAVAVVAALTLAACEGPPGEQGEQGPPGTPGQDGTPGTPGAAGDAGVGAHPGYAATTGLKFELQKVTVDNDGTVNAQFLITDEKNVPLDRTGVLSVGAVSPSFILAKLGGDAPKADYVAYTARNVAIPDGGGATVTQAGTDTGGTYTELAPGLYSYKFGKQIPAADLNASTTFAIGAYATRTVDGVRYVSNDVYHFGSSGAEVTDVAKTHDIIRTDSCERCHTRLEAHGGARRGLDTCELCHTPQTTDPDTGNTVDLMAMVHKIHMGKDLPSGDYKIIGYGNSLHDWSEAALPPPNAANNCLTCHSKFAATASEPTAVNAWKESITVSTCQTCHDRTWFGDAAAVPTGWVAHAGGPAQNPENCSGCHAPGTILSGVRLGVDVAHLTGLVRPDHETFVATITEVTGATPGATPTIKFTVKLNGQPMDLAAAPSGTSFSATFSGPAGADRKITDINGYVTTGSILTTGTRTAGAAGEYTWTPATTVKLPADAYGTWYVTLQGYILDPQGSGAEYATPNQMFPVAVTGTTAKARRVVVDDKLCDACHADLEAHGGQRTSVNYCTACHNPTNSNDERYPRPETQDGQAFTFVAPSVDLKVMIHKLHMGAELTQRPFWYAATGSYEYVYGATRSYTTADPDGDPLVLSRIHNPSPPQNCAKCHVGKSFQLPLQAGIAPTVERTFTCPEDPSADTNDLCGAAGSAVPWTLVSAVNQQPEAAACTACHDSPSARAHAETMTWTGIEACATCHGPGTDYDVVKVHQLAP